MAAEIRCNKEHRYSIALIDEDKPRTCPFCAADELQRLRAENAQLNLSLQATYDERQEVLGELQADALRYRWLRDRNGKNNRWPSVTQYPYQAAIDDEFVPQLFYSEPGDAWKYHPENLDKAIDSAIEEAKKW